MSNTVYLKSNRPGIAEKDWIYNVLVDADRVVCRVLIPLNDFDVRVQNTTVETAVDRARLMDPALLFGGEVCNYRNSALVKATVDDVEYIVIYETTLTLEDLKKSGTWHSGALCTVYVPVLSRIWQQPGFYSDATSECWHRDAGHGESMESHEAKYRRLYRVETLAQFSVIDENSTMANTDVVLNTPRCKELITNLYPTEWPEGKDVTDLMVGYDIECPSMTAVDTPVEVTVRANLKGFAKSINKTVDVKMVNGYAPMTKVHLYDGVGKFTVMPLGLGAGTSIVFQIQDYGRTCAEQEIAVL